MKNRVLLFLTAIAAVAESYIVTDTKIGSRLGQDDDRLRMTPLGSLEDRIRIEAPEPSRRMVRSGDNVTLSCEASHLQAKQPGFDRQESQPQQTVFIPLHVSPLITFLSLAFDSLVTRTFNKLMF